MVDISALADKLIALINSKPSSPRRDEIVSLLMQSIAKPQAPIVFEGPGEFVKPQVRPEVLIEMTPLRYTAAELNRMIECLGPNPGFVGPKTD
jgi:hypothetical protein